MTINEFTNIYNNIQKGAFVKCTYQKINGNGYSKITTTTIRFVDYYNIKAIKDLGKVPNQANANPNVKVLIPHVLTYNTKTNNTLVHLYLVPNAKSTTIYKDNNGKEIDKATYELAVPKKKSYNSPNNPMVMFQVKIQDLVSLG